MRDPPGALPVEFAGRFRSERPFRNLVNGALRFGEVLRKFAPASVFQLSDEVERLALEWAAEEA